MNRSPFPFIIWWAICVHILWGCALAFDPAVLPVAILVGLHWLVNLGMGGEELGIMLVFAALLAALGLVLDRRLSRRTGLLLLMPQYALLVAALVSDTQSVLTGRVDDRELDRVVLLVVLCPVMIAAVLHSVAIVERQLRWTSLR